MILLEALEQFIATIPATITQNHGIYEFCFVVAERKVMRSGQKLEYRAKFSIDDAGKILKFSEMLRESGAGLSMGETTPGFSYKMETYSKLGKAREGTITEQSSLFGKKYEYRYDFKAIRLRVEEIVEKAGYQFKYLMAL